MGDPDLPGGVARDPTQTSHTSPPTGQMEKAARKSGPRWTTDTMSTSTSRERNLRGNQSGSPHRRCGGRSRPARREARALQVLAAG